MRAILLAAGLGTRLRPLTDHVPKCLVPINGTPLLEIWLERLARHGVGPFLVNTHYRKEQVEEFVSKSKYKHSITLVHEPNLLGTAGTLRSNRDFFNEADGMLIHADNFCLANFRKFTAAHNSRSAGCLLTMMTFTCSDPSQCGVVEVDDLGVVKNFYEKIKNPPSNIANAAVYIVSNELIRDLPSGVDFSNDVLPKCIGRIQTFHTNDAMIDVGTPDRYLEANKVLGRHQ